MPADLAAAPTPMISFVICSIDAAKFAAVSSSLAEAVGGEPHEIVGVHDARSLCEGWARGLMRSRGDPVVFCHDDIEVCVRGLASRLARHLRDHDVVGVAGTDTCVGMEWSEAGIEHAYGAIVHDRGAASELCFYGAGAGTDTRVDTGVDTGVDTDVVGGIQAMDGVFLAARRPVAQAIGFDADTFDGWHGYDADFTFRAHLAGHRLAVALDLPIAHRSMGRSDEARVRYYLRFADKHAARLATTRGAWVDARMPVPTREAIVAAFGRANLDRLHAWTRSEARRAGQAAGRPYAAGRNDPCPCGSGLRYKECHGAAR